jgi:hypothetical protein
MKLLKEPSFESLARFGYFVLLRQDKTAARLTLDPRMP